MKIRSNRGLIALNAGLLLVLAVVTLAPSAAAQPRSGRTPGTYTMVSGRITGGTSHALYIIDSTNQEMVALSWNQSTRGLEAIGYRSIAADTQATVGR
jgi:hypothetical protein